MSLEWLNSAKTKINGSMLQVSNSKKLKATLQREAERLLLLMISDRHMTKLLNLKYLFGISKKSKYLKYKRTQL